MDYFSKLEAMVKVTCKIGWGAGDILHKYYRGEVDGGLDVADKKDGPVTAADLAANHYILEKLQAEFGTEDFDYLSEETYQHDGKPFPKSWVWVIDPLDGTRDFIDKTGEFGIHIALTYDHRPMLAVVVIPEQDKLYYATKGGGTFLEQRDGSTTEIKISERNKIEDLYLIASRSHRNQRLNMMVERIPFKDIVYCGGVGRKISTILEQRSDVYISLSGKSAPKDWDFAAPELILTEAGGKFTNFDGEPLQYNTGDVSQWGGLMASNGHCHQELCQMATAKLVEVDQELASKE